MYINEFNEEYCSMQDAQNFSCSSCFNYRLAMDESLKHIVLAAHLFKKCRGSAYYNDPSREVKLSFHLILYPTVTSCSSASHHESTDRLAIIYTVDM
jgi:hypothetical protein